MYLEDVYSLKAGIDVLNPEWDFESYEYPEWEFTSPDGDTWLRSGLFTYHICGRCNHQTMHR